MHEDLTIHPENKSSIRMHAFSSRMQLINNGLQQSSNVSAAYNHKTPTEFKRQTSVKEGETERRDNCSLLTV
ncbi:hypothetical protein RTP6_001982 [Batrachochytrium dendrobatidis]